MIDALERLRVLTVGAVAALLVVTLAVVVFRGFDDAATTAADAPSAGAAGASDRSGPGPGPGSSPGAGDAPADSVDRASDLVLVSQDVVLPASGATAPAPVDPASTSPRGPSAPGSSTPNPMTPVTPTAPPTSPPVTPTAPPTPPTPQPPPAPSPPAPKPAVVNVAVLSGGQVLAVDVNLGASHLVNLSLLQP